MVRTMVILAALVLLPLATGCSWSHPGAKPNDVRVQHAHDQHCGHYYHDGRWYWVMSHEHGVACGHHYYNGQWNLNPPYPGFTTHLTACQAGQGEAANTAPAEPYQHPRNRGTHTYYKD